VKGRGTGSAGDVTFTGNFQDLGENAALVLATYKFTPATGPMDQGNVDLIRNFPPRPTMTSRRSVGDGAGLPEATSARASPPSSS